MARSGRSGGGRRGRAGGARSSGRRSSYGGSHRSGSFGRSRSSIGRSHSYSRSSTSRKRSYGGGSFGSSFGGYSGSSFGGSLFDGSGMSFYDHDYGDYDSVYGEPPSFEDSLNFNNSVFDYYLGDGERENSNESMDYLDAYPDLENGDNKSFSPGKVFALIIIFVIITFVQCSM